MDSNTKWVVDIWIERLARTPIDFFYPSFPAKALELRTAEVMGRLLHHVEDGKLDLVFEFRCPDCLTPLFTGAKDSAPTSTYCPKCDLDYDVDFEDMYPIFYFTESYKNIVKKKTPPDMLRLFPTRVN